MAIQLINIRSLAPSCGIAQYLCPQSITYPDIISSVEQHLKEHLQNTYILKLLNQTHSTKWHEQPGHNNTTTGDAH